MQSEERKSRMHVKVSKFEEFGEVGVEADVLVDVELRAAVRLPAPLALQGEHVAARRYSG